MENIKVISSLSDLEANVSTNQIVLDLRNDIDLDIKQIVENIMNNEANIIQIWLPVNRAKFHEVLSRSKKLSKGNQLNSRFLMLDSNISKKDCFDLGEKVHKLYQSFDDLSEVIKAHPVYSFEKEGISVKIKTNNNKQEKKTIQIRSRKALNRPTKRTFAEIKKFQIEANKINLTENDFQESKLDRIRCYMCKLKFIELTACLCDKCWNLNESMKNENADLTGKYAIVTGGRIKIGLHTSLRLLRDGCFVIVTTRFPMNALKGYSKQPDYSAWKSRLKIYQLDLQDLTSINNFLDFVEKIIPHLDILINNAAMTIWRPSSFYKELIKEEIQPLGNQSNDISVICSDNNLSKMLPSTLSEAEYEPKRKAIKMDHVKDQLEDQQFGQLENAALNYFPSGQFDKDGQQLDLRPTNSWNLGLTDVPLQELLQTMTINSIAPFILTSKLKHLLVKSPNKRKFVVNVSAMEGQFSRITKGCRHPHTNMAKAALNMMTRTSGLEFQLDHIYMTAVDTGWCTDERPHGQAQYEADKGFMVPLNCEDGAARVYHPIFHGLKEENQPYFSVFLKNFKPHPW